MGAGLWGQGQEFARPTDIRSHGSRVQTPSRQAGLKGFEPLTYRCPSDVPMERADKSRSLYLAKLQARGGAYWPSSVKRCAGARAPFQKAHGLTDIELEYLQPVATRRWWGHLEIIPGIQQTVRACVDEPDR